MKEAVFQFKCRMCGAIADTGKPEPEDVILTKLTYAVIEGKTIRITHRCDETRVGLADLIGYRIEG